MIDFLQAVVILVLSVSVLALALRARRAERRLNRIEEILESGEEASR